MIADFADFYSVTTDYLLGKDNPSVELFKKTKSKLMNISIKLKMKWAA